jgi:hypothetical protein
MSLHVSLDLASLREPCGAGFAPWTFIPSTAEALFALLGMFDVNLRGVLEQLLGIGKDLAADSVAAFFAPETPVLLIGP